MRLTSRLIAAGTVGEGPNWFSFKLSRSKPASSSDSAFAYCASKCAPRASPEDCNSDRRDRIEPMVFSLIRDVQSQLQIAREICLRCDTAEIGASKGRVRSREQRSVERVESLGAKLNIHPLVYEHAFEQRDVPILVSWPAQSQGSGSIAEGVGGRRGESRRIDIAVQPLVQTSAGAQSFTCYSVRPLDSVACNGTVRVVALVDGNRESALKSWQHIQLPAADHRIDPTRAWGKPRALAKRKVVEHTGDKAVRNICYGVRVFRFQVVDVLWRAEARALNAVRGGKRRVHVARPGE